MNGGTHFGSMADDDAPGRVIERHCAAVPGEVPLWGQRGQFLVERGNVRALVEYEAGFGGPLGAHFQFHALDLDKPFISETGYRSHFDTARGCMTVAEVAGGILSAMLAEKKRPVMIQASYRDRLADFAAAELVRRLGAACQARAGNRHGAGRFRPGRCGLAEAKSLHREEMGRGGQGQGRGGQGRRFERQGEGQGARPRSGIVKAGDELQHRQN
jgi:hypothetical protein